MKDLSQYLCIKDLTQYKRKFNTLKRFEICDCVLFVDLQMTFRIKFFLKCEFF